MVVPSDDQYYSPCPSRPLKSDFTSLVRLCWSGTDLEAGFVIYAENTMDGPSAKQLAIPGCGPEARQLLIPIHGVYQSNLEVRIGTKASGMEAAACVQRGVRGVDEPMALYGSPGPSDPVLPLDSSRKTALARFGMSRSSDVYTL